MSQNNCINIVFLTNMGIFKPRAPSGSETGIAKLVPTHSIAMTITIMNIDILDTMNMHLTLIIISSKIPVQKTNTNIPVQDIILFIYKLNQYIIELL